MTATPSQSDLVTATAYPAASPRQWAVRLLLWLLGAWLMLTVAMAFAASANFRALDPDNLRNAAEIYAEIPAPELRQHLRYAASEINRYLFTVYSDVHVVIAAFALALVFFTRLSKKRLILAVAGIGTCFGFALIFVLWFTPTMVELGRVIDFMPRTPEPPDVTHFFSLHRINVAMEMTKMLLLLAVAAVLLKR